MRKAILLLIVIGFMLSGSSYADSLWVKDSKSMIEDKKANKQGDLVTVIIAESSSSIQQASKDYNKKLDHSNGSGSGPVIGLLPEISVSSSQKGSSGGSASRANSFRAKLTATITEVLANGDFRLEGTRSIETNGEKEEMKFRGTVRPEDIQPDNTVQSTFVADAKIEVTGKGAINDRQQKEGIISRIVKFLF